MTAPPRLHMQQGPHIARGPDVLILGRIRGRKIVDEVRIPATWSERISGAPRRYPARLLIYGRATAEEMRKLIALAQLKEPLYSTLARDAGVRIRLDIRSEEEFQLWVDPADWTPEQLADEEP